jgi:hypothetical protein
MPENEKNEELTTQLWGWVLFILCAILFILSGIRAGDILTTAGSIVFLIACMVFLMPVVKAIRQDR